MHQALSRFFFGLLIFISWSSLVACKAEDPNDKLISTQSKQNVANEDLSDQEAETQTEQESFTGPTCQDLDIPSWERRINRLAEELCARCHNDKFAWNGARLDNYEQFVLNSEAAIERIRTRDLTITVNVLEAKAFIDWYEAGMPKTEKNCAESAKAPL